MSDTDAGSGQPAGTIGDVVPAVMGFSVDVNRSDGFVTPVRSDVWFVDVAAATVTLNDGAPVSAGVEQVQALVRALAASAYRIRQSCCIYEFVDGYPNSPVIAVSDGLTNHLFGVGDSPCWRTANAFEGEVIGCADFGAIFASLEAIAPSATPFQCRWYL